MRSRWQCSVMSQPKRMNRPMKESQKLPVGTATPLNRATWSRLLVSRLLVPTHRLHAFRKTLGRQHLGCKTAASQPRLLLVVRYHLEISSSTGQAGLIGTATGVVMALPLARRARAPRQVWIRQHPT